MDFEEVDRTVERLRKKWKVGRKFYMSRRGPFHVRAFVDDSVVCRIWNKQRRYWDYQVFHWEVIAMSQMTGHLK